MENKKATRHKFYILLFGAATFLLCLTFAYLKAREFWLANGGGLSIEEGYQRFGDSAVWAIGMTTMIAFLIIGPAIFFVSSSIIYGIGFLFAQWRSNQVGFGKYWLVYPVFSIIIVVTYCLFVLF